MIFFLTGQGYNQDGLATNEGSQHWDRLLIEEIPQLKENIEGIPRALDKNNYTLAREQINEIQSGDYWFNIRKELESRNQNDHILNFNNSVSKLDELTRTENAGSIKQAQILLKDFDKIVQTLGQPVIDIPRLLIVILIIGTLIAFGLYIIPKLRNRLNIKF
ncbi:MAG TPA: hypothetical protein VJ599_05725 [Nitrososphaeraceae archaeon]|nr:hypothetical protein [Nitrososphaeraceae archaeon]